MRTTSTAVLNLIELDEGVTVTQFIESANMLVTEKCDTVANSYSVERLEMIERYLAAHFAAVKYPRTTSESAAGTSESYQTSVGMFLELSTFGQHAMILDTGGGLARLNKNIKDGIRSVASLMWMGTL